MNFDIDFWGGPHYLTQSGNVKNSSDMYTIECFHFMNSDSESLSMQSIYNIQMSNLSST